MSNPGDITFRYSIILYRELVKLSYLATPEEMLEYEYPITEGEEYRIVNFYVKDIVESTGIVAASLTNTLFLLKQMRCVDKLRTGTRNYGSVYLLNYEPTREQFEKWRKEEIRTNYKIHPNKSDFMLAELRNLKDRVTTLEDVVRSHSH